MGTVGKVLENPSELALGEIKLLLTLKFQTGIIEKSACHGDACYLLEGNSCLPRLEDSQRVQHCADAKRGVYGFVLFF